VEDPVSAFWEDLARDMKDPAFAKQYPHAIAEFTGRKRWGVRMPDGTLHYSLLQGDAENLAVITDGQLVAWVNDGWEDQE